MQVVIYCGKKHYDLVPIVWPAVQGVALILPDLVFRSNVAVVSTKDDAASERATHEIGVCGEQEEGAHPR
jgi:hypothetical protein